MPEEVICSRILRDGEQLDIKMATPPLSKRLINAFLRTPELSATRHESRKRLFGGLRGQSSDYFFAGELGEKFVGTCWYCTPATCKEIAYMGEVFTNKKQRNKGVAASLLEVAIDFFRKEGGRAFYVTNLCPRAPHAIYGKLGFQAYGYGEQAYGGLIRLVIDERGDDFDREYYKYDQKTSTRTVNWGDLPHFIALLNYPHDWIVRAYNFGLIGPVIFDELGQSFMNFMRTLKADNICLVLENSNGRVVGTAYSSSLPAKSQSHVKIVDFLVHPNYYAEAPRLLTTLIEELGRHGVKKLQAYVAATDDSKAEILRLCEFKKEATMQHQLRIGNKKSDLEIYSYRLHDQDLQTDHSYHLLL